MNIRASSDEGRPIVAIEPDSAHAKLYVRIARDLWSAVSAGGTSKPAPRIVIE
jgi:ATP-binding protein involved in chromosome partitioning